MYDEQKQNKLYYFFIIIFSTFKLKAIDFGDDSFERVISILEEAMIDKSIDKLQKCIAPEFSVSVALMPSAVKYIESILNKIKQ